jgi:hypothetical protein
MVVRHIDPHQDEEFRLTTTRLDNQSIDDWRDRLAERGWEAEAPIRHPFQMDSFRGNGRQIRLEYDSVGASSITVFGLNTLRGE